MKTFPLTTSNFVPFDSEAKAVTTTLTLHQRKYLFTFNEHAVNKNGGYLLSEMKLHFFDKWKLAGQQSATKRIQAERGEVRPRECTSVRTIIAGRSQKKWPACGKLRCMFTSMLPLK